MVRLRMMTLETPALRKKPPPTICPPVPTPTMVLFDATRSSVPLGLILIWPGIRMMYACVDVTYSLSCSWVVAVTVWPPAPPVVGPRPRLGSAAKPSAVFDQLRPGPVGGVLVGGLLVG